jgi:PPOX class probable F420-dependent enzyme
MSVIDESSAARLSSAPLGWLTTVRADGQPQTSYIWFHWDGEDLVILSQPTAQKIRNLASDLRVSFHLDGDVTEGNGVLTLDATAEILGDRLPADRLAAYMAKYEDRIRNNLSSTPEQYHAGFSVAVRIVPTRLRAW